VPSAPDPLRIYIGDDRTDEDAFQALGPHSITIHVRVRKETQVLFRLADVERVWAFLENCLRLLQNVK
jgi:trehalose-phosphatase